MRSGPDVISGGFDAAFYLEFNPDVSAAGVSPSLHYSVFGWREGRDPNAYVSTAFYLGRNPDVAAAGVDPLRHYLEFGAREGRDPSPSFDTDAYLAANPDVAAAGANPLQHVLAFGVFEGRLPTQPPGPLFFAGTSGADDLAGGARAGFFVGAGGDDVLRAGAGHDTVRYGFGFDAYGFAFDGAGIVVTGPEGTDSLTGFERFSFRDVTIDRADGSILVDDLFYLAANRDVFAAGVDAKTHYDTFGWREGRNPNAWFDTAWYLAANPDVAAAGANPLEHYLLFGAAEGRDPSSRFDTSFYLGANPDVAASRTNPLVHFLAFGLDEGRAPRGAQDGVPPAAPVITGFADDSGTAGDGITRDATPTLSGTAEALSTVRDGVAVGTVAADGAGAWTFASPALADGRFVFTAVATDAAGNVGPPSAGLAIGVDTAAPALAVASDDAALNRGDDARVTFTFSEVPVGFTAGDILLSGGLSLRAGSFAQTDPRTYTAVVDPAAAFEGSASVSVAAGSYTDQAGNAGTAATGPTIAVDTVDPTMSVAFDQGIVQRRRSGLGRDVHAERGLGGLRARGRHGLGRDAVGLRLERRELHGDLHGAGRLDGPGLGVGRGRRLHGRSREREHRLERGHGSG